MTELISAFDDHEHEYKIAGWLGTIQVMKKIEAMNIKRLQSTKSLNRHVLRLCSAIESNPDSVPDTIRNWIRHRTKYDERLSEIQKLGVVTREPQLDQNFATAYDIYSGAGWQTKPTTTTQFGRLLPITSELVDHHTILTEQQLHGGADLADAINLARKDIEFYVGHYDPKA